MCKLKSMMQLSCLLLLENLHQPKSLWLITTIAQERKCKYTYIIGLKTQIKGNKDKRSNA